MDETRHSTAERERLRRTGLRLEWGTIWWNLGEAVITLGLGIAAGSLALAGFGIDSLIEVFASAVVVWHVADPDEIGSHHRNTRALRLIAIAFVALGVVLMAGAIQRLATKAVPDESWWGVAYLALAAVVMFGLAIAKRHVGHRLESRPLLAEARITLLDAALATSVLVALVLNAALGWWWADPLAAAVVAAVALREGWEHWQETRETPAPA